MVISVGVFVDSKEDIDRLKVLADQGINCHVEFFHFSHFLDFGGDIPDNLRVASLHAFNAGKTETFDEYIKKLEHYRAFFAYMNIDKEQEFMVTIHPNRFGEEFANIPWLYPENFPYKKKKKLRSPFHILRSCGRMTLDTSHLDPDVVRSEQLMRALVQNADIIHFSQRTSIKAKDHHKPINHQGEILTGLVIRILKQSHYNVKQLVLEYMPDYFYQQIKDYNYLHKLLKL